LPTTPTILTTYTNNNNIGTNNTFTTDLRIFRAKWNLIYTSDVMIIFLPLHCTYRSVVIHTITQVFVGHSGHS